MTDTVLETAPSLAIDETAADLIFRHARTTSQWADAEVSDARLQAAWDLAKLGPTAMNTLPLRVLVVRSTEARQRLVPHMAEGNRPKVEAAPVSLVLAADPAFHEHLDELFPVYPGIREQLAPAAEMREAMARKNALLQAGYLVVALRSVGLATGPMDGMDLDGVDGEFFAESGWKSLMVVNVGVAEGEGSPYPRNPRLSFDQVSQAL
ncbi:malonic semialdehyde reductase [Isoptericola halotolerans]|uniref:3-hydroxypropanoate dehydrogenase n=1 Tax=Isoptericola halotolerans TaxID=300560 RepID=A0ABX2A3V8_9MICO|nr:malonic semialdehyde reductase [Isoptericola halotolerans]NOV96283.1 3-hydroxypropanoate dehydrogenase [Isoptericola halotolerans]